MRRISRLDRSIDVLRSTSTLSATPPYLCSACKVQSTHFSTLSRFRQEKKPFTQTLREKIWGTSQPPGLEDPYERNPSAGRKSRALEKAKEANTREDRPQPREYVRATTWDDLEELAPPEPRSIPINAFGPAEIVTEKDEITTALHRALVEVFALRQAGRQLSEAWQTQPVVDQTHTVQIRPRKSGHVELVFSESFSLEKVLESLSLLPEAEPDLEDIIEHNPGRGIESEADVEASTSHSPDMDEMASKTSPPQTEDGVADESPVDPPHPQLTYEDVIKSWGKSWLLVPLHDPEVKFAVLKRVMLLTGIRVTDSSIKGISTAENLLKILAKPAKPAKPTKLIDELVERNNLMNLPNISVYAKKVTKTDKEIQVGRWKLIEKELERRGLPVNYERGSL